MNKASVTEWIPVPLAFQYNNSSMLLDGCETVEECLERDTSVKYTTRCIISDGVNGSQVS